MSTPHVPLSVMFLQPVDSPFHLKWDSFVQHASSSQKPVSKCHLYSQLQTFKLLQLKKTKAFSTSDLLNYSLVFLLCFLECTGEPGLGDFEPVFTGMVPRGHTESQGSEDHQFQHFLEERPGLLCHLTPLPPRENVRVHIFLHALFLQ